MLQTIHQTSAKKKKNSNVWLNFEEITEGGKKKVKYLIEGCGQKLAFHGNTSAMAYHFES